MIDGPHQIPLQSKLHITELRGQAELCKVHIWHTLDALGGVDGQPDVSRGLYIDRCFLEGSDENSLLDHNEGR